MTQRASVPLDGARWAPFLWTLAGCLLLVGAQTWAIWRWFREPGTAPIMVLVDDGSRCLLAAWAAWSLSVLAKKDHSGYGATWRWMAIALASLAAGTLYLVVAVDLAKIGPPWSLLRHVGYLGFLVALGRSLLLMPTARILPTGRIQAVLDGVMISAALFFVAWGSFLKDLALRYRDAGTRYDLALVYSLAALTLASIWLTQEGQGPSIRFKGPALLLRVGLGLTVFWWTQFGVLSIPGYYRQAGLAELLDLGMLASLACFALAARWPRESFAAPPPSTRPRGVIALSFLPALGALVYGSIVLMLGRSLDVVMVFAGALLGLTLCVRQYLALQDLENLSAELEARVEARTREVRERQEALLEAQRMQVVASLAAGFAHDFKNALTVIDNWCELLEERPSDDTLNHGLHAIKQSSAKALGSVQKVLSAGRQQVLHPKPMDLPGAIRTHQTVLQGALGSRAQLLLEFPDQLPVVFDPSQLEDILLNLVGNAGDAMTSVGTVTLRAFQDEAEPFAVLQVEDMGAGIPPEIMPFIFDPFTTTKATGQGTGLGLASVKGVLWQCGGSIEVASEVGRGTTFTLRLPQ